MLTLKESSDGSVVFIGQLDLTLYYTAVGIIVLAVAVAVSIGLAISEYKLADKSFSGKSHTFFR